MLGVFMLAAFLHLLTNRSIYLKSLNLQHWCTHSLQLFVQFLFFFLQTVAVYFNQVMAAIEGNTAGPGDAVLNVYINHDKKFAFVEMRFVEEASNSMALDGIMFEGALKD